MNVRVDARLLSWQRRRRRGRSASPRTDRCPSLNCCRSSSTTCPAGRGADRGRTVTRCCHTGVGAHPGDPARRHGRVLRVGRTAAPARARRQAGRRRRHRPPGSRRRRVVRGRAGTACSRRCRRRGPGSSARRPCSCRATTTPTRRRARRCTRCSSRTRPVSRESRSTRRSSTSPAPVTLFGDGVTIGHRIRADIADRMSLTCSVGVAPNKFLAKMASVEAKPRAAPERGRARSRRVRGRARATRWPTSTRFPCAGCGASGRPRTSA